MTDRKTSEQNFSLTPTSANVDGGCGTPNTYTTLILKQTSLMGQMVQDGMLCCNALFKLFDILQIESKCGKEVYSCDEPGC